MKTWLRPRPTARQKLADTLAAEILSGLYPPPNTLPSEHQLCRRFSVSRVTVRLALSDLQTRGLIYRHHGKGTFAHGSGKPVYKPLGLLVLDPKVLAAPAVIALLQGLTTTLAESGTPLTIITSAPEQWPGHLAPSLGGVVVLPSLVTGADLESLQRREVPFYVFSETDLPGPCLWLGLREATAAFMRKLIEMGHRRFALLRGASNPFDMVRNQGIHDSLQEAGLGTGAVLDYEAGAEASAGVRVADLLLSQGTMPTAVIAFDECLAAQVLAAARVRNLSVPGDLSVAAFVDNAASPCPDPTLTRVRGPFYECGRSAARQLCEAAVRAQMVEDIRLEPSVEWGQTTAAVG